MEAYHQIKAELAPHQATLVAVSKTHPPERIMELYELGHRDFGENRQSELVEKYEKLPKDIRWHFIGHLQSKKTKYIAPFVYMIHSVDSFKLLREINKQAERNDRIIDCLLQFKIAKEESKYGLEARNIREEFTQEALQEFRSVNIRGVMGMATFTDDMDQVRTEFKKLKAFFDELKLTRFPEKEDFDQISMGMTGDYKVALEEGSTMIRVGTLLFGERQYG
jgi:hypothetical protein